MFASISVRTAAAVLRATRYTMSLAELPPKKADGSVPAAPSKYAAWRWVRFVTVTRLGDRFVFLMKTNGTTNDLTCVNGAGLMPTASGEVLETATFGTRLLVVAVTSVFCLATS